MPRTVPAGSNENPLNGVKDGTPFCSVSSYGLAVTHATVRQFSLLEGGLSRKFAYDRAAADIL